MKLFKTILNYKVPLKYLVLIFLSIHFGQAKDYVDLFKSHYLFSPNNSFDSNNEKTDYSEYTADLFLPVKVDSNNVLITGSNYGLYRFKQDTSLTDLSSFHAISFKLGINKKLGKKWSGTFVYIPQILSTLDKTISSRDFQSGFAAFFEYKKTDRLSYKFGGYYIKDLRGPFLLPLAGLYYTSPNSKWEFDALLPSKFDVNYQIRKNLKWGLNYSITVKSFYEGINENYVYLFGSELSTYLQFDVGKGLLIQTDVGVNSRTIEEYRYGDRYDFNFSSILFGDNRTLLNDKWDSSIIFLKMSLKFRYKIPKPKAS